MVNVVKRGVRALFLWITLALSTVVLFDIGCFFVLPQHFSERIFIGYRTGVLPDGSLGRGEPHDYYEAHPERGFDIGASKSERLHYVFNYPTHYSYPIWSNSLGCFDVEHPHLDTYVYLAGDSTTWGYTRFEKKFGTLLEQKLHVPVVKCGVTHSGQFHQLSKMKEVIATIGGPPKIILVVWSPNDIVNDAFYPHSTVIDGWMVDTTYVTFAKKIVHDPLEVIAERVRRILRAQYSVWWKPQSLLIKYSAAYNVLCQALFDAPIGGRIADSMYDNPPRFSIYSLHDHPPSAPALSYRGNELARKNQEALLQLQAYANTIHAKLVVALLSPQPHHNVEVGEFLKEHGIRHIDLGDSGYNFNAKHLAWRIDPHANEEGNKVIADALYRFMQPELVDNSRLGQSLRN